MQDYEIYWMDEFHRNLKLNLKYHLGEYVGKGWNQGGAWSFKTVLLNDCKIVDCGGEPKPTELLHDYTFNDVGWKHNGGVLERSNGLVLKISVLNVLMGSIYYSTTRG